MKAANEWEKKIEKVFTKRDVGHETVQTYCKHNSTLLFCPVYNGVLLWSNEIRDNFMPFSPEMEGNYITFNYCSHGRCEIAFPVGNRYIYMKKGMLSLNQIQPVDGYYYPGNKYDGLELAFDLDALTEGFPDALSAYGLTKAYLLELIDRHNALLLASVNQKVQSEADHLLAYIKSGDVSVERLRFEILRLFFLIKEEGLSFTKDIAYVSKGQRQIATQVEALLTEDLSRHYVLSDIAKTYGISASALKKYFTQVYGTHVSDYLRIKRMERAMALLTETTQSIKDIALQAGYTHQGKFSEAFKEYTGSTPMEYRRLNYRKVAYR